MLRHEKSIEKEKAVRGIGCLVDYDYDYDYEHEHEQDVSRCLLRNA